MGCPQVVHDVGLRPERLNDAEVQIIDDAGHLLPFEQPQELSKTILRWFARKDIKLT